jgi:hypothetical protein
MYDLIRNDINWAQVKTEFRHSAPFNHVVIDDFFLPGVAEEISREFPSFDDPELGYYNNAIEKKKCCNKWDKFGKFTYHTFSFLGREGGLLNNMRYIIDDHRLELDFGLNGGGWHLHGPSGNLNVHLDYNIHPKLDEQRKLNIIIYMTKDWKPEWGGGLELWSHNDNTYEPKELVKTVENVYNRAVIFDTTQNSWHGLPKELTCPEGVYRKSLAAYYVRPTPQGTVDFRGKALFAPREEQKDDPDVAELIRRRASTITADKYYNREKEGK